MSIRSAGGYVCHLAWDDWKKECERKVPRWPNVTTRRNTASSAEPTALATFNGPRGDRQVPVFAGERDCLARGRERKHAGGTWGERTRRIAAFPRTVCSVAGPPRGTGNVPEVPLRLLSAAPRSLQQDPVRGSLDSPTPRTTAPPLVSDQGSRSPTIGRKPRKPTHSRFVRLNRL